MPNSEPRKTHVLERGKIGNRKAMIVAGIATIPSRIEQVKKTIESLLPQVDRIYVSLNDFRPSPIEMIALAASNTERVFASFTDGADEQKFRNVEGDIYLTCDDDLIYPPQLRRSNQREINPLRHHYLSRKKL